MRKGLLVITMLCLSLSFSIFINRPVFAESDDNNGAGNVVVQTIPGPSLAQKIVDRTQVSWPWYIVRGSGIIAALALIILILSGVGLVTGQTFRFMEPLTAWATHRALGIVMAISVVIHMITLLFDHFVSFNLLNLLVPWLSDYKPVTILGVQLGSLYIALGILAFYGIALVTITSLVWIEKKPYLWKIIHLLSYLVLVFVFVHALYLGTDLAGGFLRWLWIALGVVTALAVIQRLWRARTI